MMDKNYDPNIFEDDIYKKWEDSGYFNPDNLKLNEDAPNYSMVLPPPNITAKLHLGHASIVAIEDLFIRHHRMKGFRTLWIPGTDHASIATQNVVEKKLLKEEGKTRHDLGKEKFLEEVWTFLEETQNTILSQVRKLGASIDWSRTAFTLDEKRQEAVKKMFIEMYNEGIIYRGERIVNWCPRCKSTLADDEVEHKEQKAFLYTFKYSKDFPISISTTRVETKLGDTAIAVNPKDERYSKYIGQVIKTSFCGQDLEIKIIADHNVEMDFGTGALGVTPAHSMIDWQMAQKNDLKNIKVIDEDGLIKDSFTKFAGKTSNEAREMIVEELEKEGLIESKEEIENNLSICYRCNTAIEPLPSKQWFIGVDKKIERLGNKSLKEKAIEAAKSNEVEFIPERFSKRYLDWMENLHDWCISRQIWFGHQIPAWHKDGEVYVGEESPGGEWTQDPDTLDTWFSSGMWTFSTLDWPEKEGDLKKFHPTQMLETGYEIITLWVSRMIMMSIFALNEVPFKKVYLHGMILDKDGQKMSKSKGNGIDPIDVISEFGTDSLRLSLLTGSTPGNDLRISEEKISSSRNFINKLWNISRFIITNNQSFSDKYESENLSLVDKWLLTRINKLIKKSSSELDLYNFSLAGDDLKNFTWNDLADWYLEAKKFEKNDNNEKILLHSLKTILKMWHPFIPFVSEAIWSQLKEEDLLMVSEWPEANNSNFEEEEGQFELIKDIISSIRNARSANKIEPSKKISAIINNKENEDLIRSQEHLIKNLKTGIETIEYNQEISDDNIIKISVSGIEIYLIGAIDEEKEKERIEKEVANLEKMISIIESKLKNESFANNAPREIVDKEKERLKKYKEDLEKTRK